MVSLSVGANNFPTQVYENPSDLVDWLASEMQAYGVKPQIEAFDLSHILMARHMWDKGQISNRPYVQSVMGVKNAMPADRDVFAFCIRTVHRLLGPDAPWCAPGIGPNQSVLNDWAVSFGVMRVPVRKTTCGWTRPRLRLQTRRWCSEWWICATSMTVPSPLGSRRAQVLG